MRDSPGAGELVIGGDPRNRKNQLNKKKEKLKRVIFHRLDHKRLLQRAKKSEHSFKMIPGGNERRRIQTNN